MSYLLDTNVLSRFLRGRGAVIKARLAAHLPVCRLSAIVLMELEYGAAKSAEVGRLRERIAMLRAIFPSVDNFDSSAAYHAGCVRAYLAKMKPSAQPIGPYDVLLAGQAISLGAVLVTHNMSEFSRVPGLACEDWQAAEGLSP